MALDLRTAHPRSPFAELGGLPWLARMIDKIRASHSGTLGEYVPYPCPADQRFLDFLGLEAEAFAEAVKHSPDDDSVLGYIADHAQPKTRSEIDAFRQVMLTPATDPERLERLAKAREALKGSHREADIAKIHNGYTLICIEEGHALPDA